MARPDYAARARTLQIDHEYAALCELWKGYGLQDESHLLDVPPRLRYALGLVEGAIDVQSAVAQLRRAITSLDSVDDRVLAHVAWNLSDGDVAYVSRDLQWLRRLSKLAEDGLTRWSTQDTLRKEANRIAFQVCRWLLDEGLEDPPGQVNGFRDPYSLFVAGVMAYARVLHVEERDPALLRLRSATSLTLHVLGYHAERIELGGWAEQAARYVGDWHTLLSVLMDDLGWANYLLGRDAGIRNIKRAITEGEAILPADRDDEWALLLAKAHRHLGVIESEMAGRLADEHFDEAKTLIAGVSDPSARQAAVDLAHVHYARALAIAHAARIDDGPDSANTPDAERSTLLRRALVELRQGRDGFREASDQGRYAKSLVLEVQILRALGEDDEARALEPVRDRAVKSSVWSRPAGRRFIAGKPQMRYDWSNNG